VGMYYEAHAQIHSCVQGASMQVHTKYRFIWQWGALLLALLLLAGAVIHNLNKSHQDIRSGEEQRLMTQVRVINVNLSSQLQGTDRILRIIRDDLVKAPADRWSGVTTNNRLEALVAAMPRQNASCR